MTIMLEGFKIATEFAFDAGLASAEVGGLQQKVQSLSDTADSAIGSLSGLGLKFAMEFSGMAGGMLSFLGQSISASDQFTQMQLKFSNIISANIGSLTGHVDTFNERMTTSKRIINDIVGDARKFGLPAKELAAYTAQMSAVLVSHGLAGENFKSARDLSRNLLKSAPTLGVHPANVMNQLQNALLGRASMQGQLMPRLMQETPAFKTETGAKMTIKQFNALEMSKRMEILSKAMRTFSSDMDVLAANANTVSGILLRVKDLFSGLGSVLKPIGDAILKPLIPLINVVINYIKTNGKVIADSIARFIKPLLDSPKEFFLNLMQLKSLASDVGSAAAWTSTFLALSHLTHLIRWIGNSARNTAVGNMFSGLMTKFPLLAGLGTRFMGVMDKIGGFFAKMFGTGILASLMNLTAGFATLTVLFQAWSRATAKLKIEKFTFWASQAPKISEMFTRLRESLARFMAPINDIIEGWSELFVVMRDGTAVPSALVWVLELVTGAIEDTSMAFIKLYAGVNSIITGVMGLVANMLDMVTKVYNSFTGGHFFDTNWIKNLKFGDNMESMAEEWMRGYDDVMTKYVYKADNDQDGGVSKKITNIGTQNNSINMNLKNQMQPDRIAFTVKDQLQKLTENRTASRGSVQATGFATV